MSRLFAAAPSSPHPLKRINLSQRGYAISNRLINWGTQLLGKEWDRRLLGLAALPIGTILDIGANEGQFSRRMSRLFPAAQIYAFEPLPVALAPLKHWAQQQQGRVQVLGVALGETHGTVEMQQHLYFSASSSVLPTTPLGEAVYPIMAKQQGVAVVQMPLDAAIAQLPPLPPGDLLIKLDVQGYEDRVIQGGEQTFRRAKACIVEISLDPLYNGQATFHQIFELLSRIGYCYSGNLDQIQAKDGHVIYLNALFINSSTASCSETFHAPGLAQNHDSTASAMKP
ncbi:FkbM family methyltransferase [Nodosilinea nodulosa]|uniref:FkbM family methyltransferase n=1 Tax=Nodosilinea nodulosa TaxID=416001 RepID=UPI0002DD7F9E|nr:FkbM family methyltransferase [Nodosilinea nodulosa]